MTNKSDALARLERWYRSMCNGDWEHTYGITLETVDNPGWMFTVELTDTPLENKPFETIATRVDDTDWLHCAVKDRQFRGSGGIGNLERIIEIFLDWAESG